VRVRVIAAGTRLPAWLATGVTDYVRRMPRESPVELIEVPLERARGGGAAALSRGEGRRMLAAVAPGTYVVALLVEGRTVDSPELAAWWGKRLQDGRDLAFLIGGPDGLAPDCRRRADESLALSRLTLPHGLARLLLVEQLYRVSSLLKGHPYHRG
jgi:23S rRNA (pseudouridine1915-N3)-methyltransferase